MIKKYEFTGKTKVIGTRTLHRIRRVFDGVLGGWIEKEANLSHDGGCWVHDQASVYEDAQVHEDAMVTGNSSVSGDARIGGAATIHGKAVILGDAVLFEQATVGGIATVRSGILFGVVYVGGVSYVDHQGLFFGSSRIVRYIPEVISVMGYQISITDQQLCFYGGFPQKLSHIGRFPCENILSVPDLSLRSKLIHEVQYRLHNRRKF